VPSSDLLKRLHCLTIPSLKFLSYSRAFGTVLQTMTKNTFTPSRASPGAVYRRSGAVTLRRRLASLSGGGDVEARRVGVGEARRERSERARQDGQQK